MLPETHIDRNLTLQELLHASQRKTESYRHTTPTSSSTSNANGLHEYDQMINTTRVILAELGQKRNALLPIIALPIEILMKIFMVLQDQPEEVLNIFSPDVAAPFSVRDLFGVYTGVCHHWRRVTLSDPFLWRNILLESGQGGPATIAEGFITRSAPLPIRLIYYPKATTKDQVAQVDDFFLTLSEAKDRLEQLVVPGSAAKKANQYILGLLQEPLKNLRRLAINCRSAAVEQQLRTLEAPSLRILSLGNANSIPQRLLPNLTHFELKSHGRLQLGPFLELLCAMPLLQVLILDDATPYFEEGFVRRSIDLPLIKYIELKESRAMFREPFALIHNLNLTPDTFIAWGSSITSYEIDDPEMAPPQTMLDPVTCLLLETTGNMNSIQGNCMTMDMRERSYLFPLLPNIRLLARSTGASDNTVWTSALPNVEEYHVQASAISPALIWELERRDHPVFPNLVTLCLWKRLSESLDNVFDKIDGNKNSELQELRKTLESSNGTTRTRSNGTTYRLELRSTSGPRLSLDWMLALSNPIS